MQGELAKSALFVPLIRGGELTASSPAEHRPRARLQRGGLRLLTTLASSLSVALENARLVEETRQRASELAIVNEVGQAVASQLDLDRLIRTHRRAAPDDLPRRHRLRRPARPGHRTDRLPVPRRARPARAAAADAARRGPDLPDPRVARAAAHEPGRAVRGGGTGGVGTPRSRTSASRSSSATRPSARQRPEHRRGGPVRRRRHAPPVDDRLERRRGDPERPALPGGAAPGPRDGGARRGRPRDLGDARSRAACSSASPTRRGAARGPNERRVPRRGGRPDLSGPSRPSARSPRSSRPTPSSWARGSSATLAAERPGRGRQRRPARPARRADRRDADDERTRSG